ncbi:hypothetical protein GR11A_00195 [Vibrio phage vB_VcorM_GR11A]|nr:hypothetical protein GR11A_00195 [Vibrio phage vB_VcorM_GR11A]
MDLSPDTDLGEPVGFTEFTRLVNVQNQQLTDNCKYIEVNDEQVTDHDQK